MTNKTSAKRIARRAHADSIQADTVAGPVSAAARAAKSQAKPAPAARAAKPRAKPTPKDAYSTRYPYLYDINGLSQFKTVVRSFAADFPQWMLLLAGSALLIWGMRSVGLPGAWLLGPMIAGIVVGVNRGSIRVSPLLLLGAQAILGCMIAGLMTRPVLSAFLRQWPLFVVVTSATIVAGGVLGRLLSRRGVLPGTTAIWGLSPGAASAMMLMAEANGGDPRLVAFMQYLRVICVSLTASLIGRWWIVGSVNVGANPVAIPGVHLAPLAATLAVAVLGTALALRLKIASGALLVPMAAGSILQASGVVEIELPRELILATFVLLGWSVGLRFTRAGLTHASRSLPAILASIAVLIVFCGTVGLILHRVAGVDPLTAYLATSPGGIDSAIVIASSTKVDLAFVMAMQIFRAIVVLLIGPTFARRLAR